MRLIKARHEKLQMKRKELKTSKTLQSTKHTFLLAAEFMMRQDSSAHCI